MTFFEFPQIFKKNLKWVCFQNTSFSKWKKIIKKENKVFFLKFGERHLVERGFLSWFPFSALFQVIRLLRIHVHRGALGGCAVCGLVRKHVLHLECPNFTWQRLFLFKVEGLKKIIMYTTLVVISPFARNNISKSQINFCVTRLGTPLSGLRIRI